MFILRRLGVAIPTLLALIVISFVLMHVAPGNPFVGEKNLSKEVMANINARYGLDQPYWQQLLGYIWNIVAHFDFGPSFKFRDRSVNDIIAHGFPVLACRFLSISVTLSRITRYPSRDGTLGRSQTLVSTRSGPFVRAEWRHRPGRLSWPNGPVGRGIRPGGVGQFGPAPDHLNHEEW